MIVALFQSPSDRLSQSCSSNPDLDIDAVVVTLSPEKRFVVEEMTLQSMQPLTQWVADLALYLIASLSHLHSTNAHQLALFPGATLVRDARALGTLRELLVIVRTWGLISTGCLPRFTTLSSGIDCLAQLFRFLLVLFFTFVNFFHFSGPPASTVSLSYSGFWGFFMFLYFVHFSGPQASTV